MPWWPLIAASIATADASEPSVPPVQHALELFDSSDGLPSSTTYDVAQDERGWLWVSTMEGIARMDGARTIRVTGPGFILHGSSGPHNRILAVEQGGRLYDIDGDAVHPLATFTATYAQVDSRGRVWAVADDALVVESDRGWEQVPGPWQEPPTLLGASTDGAVFVGAGDVVLRVSEHEAVAEGSVHGAIAAVERDDGIVAVIANTRTATNDGGAVFALHDGVARVVYAPGSRALDIATK